MCVKMVSEKQKFCVTFQIFSHINQHIDNLLSYQQTENQKDKSTTVYRNYNPDPEPSLNQEVLIHNFSTYAMI